MAKQLKSIKFPGLEEIYEIPENSIDIDFSEGEISGELVGINAQYLNGLPAEEYVRKDDAMVITKNYSVVGGMEEPENPTENMIWIKTENTNIGKVSFNKYAPKNPVNGDVWISTSTSSPVAFESLKVGNDTLNIIYPTNSSQYLSGEWIKLETKSYQNGSWVDWWRGELFQDGYEFEHVTGGWVCTPKGFSSSAAGVANNAILERNGTTLTMYMGSSGNGGGAMYHTAKPVDLREYTQLTFEGAITGSASSTSQCNMRVWPGPDLPEYTQDSAASISIRESDFDGAITLDITNCNIEEGYYIGFGTYSNSPQIIMRSMMLS